MIEQWSTETLRAALPLLSPQANKYTRGHLFVVAGCAEYPGAACLCAAAAQRAGAGYVSVACAPESVPTVRSFRPSLVVRSWEDWDPSRIPAPHNGRPAAIALGCGFDSHDDKCVSGTLIALRDGRAPLLLDGGALGILSTEEGLHSLRWRHSHQSNPLVLTPHGGEASHLASAPGISETLPPEQLASALAQFYRATVALKGPRTYISNGERTVLMAEGTVALAKAGTGDVLAGIIGSLLAQGCQPLEACVVGCTLHARAGRIAVERTGEISLIPEDLLDTLPKALQTIA